MSVVKRKIIATVEVRVIIDADVPDEWTWDDIYDDVMDAVAANLSATEITDAWEVD